jgi:hypothetical protein
VILSAIALIVVGVNIAASGILRQPTGRSWRGQLSLGTAMMAGGMCFLFWWIVAP